MSVALIMVMLSQMFVCVQTHQIISSMCGSLYINYISIKLFKIKRKKKQCMGPIYRKKKKAKYLGA